MSYRCFYSGKTLQHKYNTFRQSEKNVTLNESPKYRSYTQQWEQMSRNVQSDLDDTAVHHRIQPLYVSLNWRLLFQQTVKLLIHCEKKQRKKVIQMQLDRLWALTLQDQRRGMNRRCSTGCCREEWTCLTFWSPSLLLDSAGRGNNCSSHVVCVGVKSNSLYGQAMFGGCVDLQWIISCLCSSWESSIV